jgi:dienelactone hydrolase
LASDPLRFLPGIRKLSTYGVLLMAACTLFAGCTHPPPKPDAATVNQFTVHAYASDQRFTAVTSLFNWTVGDAHYDLALTAPDKPGSYPLVIYLPGLGETRDAGILWRTAWAQAGYAVLSVQAFVEDASGWTAPKSRPGDFAALARVRYSANIALSRIEALDAMWRELLRRQANGEPPLDRIDISHVAVAGFDLGAYTAMTLAGENLRDVAKPAAAIPIAAAIALSPYADFSGATFSQRYRDISGPVLAVTTDSDADAIGLVTSPSVRKAPFEYMPDGNKFLMVLWSVPHFVLGGDKMDGPPPEVVLTEADKPVQARAPTPPPGPNTGTRPRTTLPEPVSHSDPAATGTVLTATINAIGTAAISGVTTAFLDAYLKNDPVAAEWLAKDAPRWLREKGEFKKK